MMRNESAKAETVTAGRRTVSALKPAAPAVARVVSAVNVSVMVDNC